MLCRLTLKLKLTTSRAFAENFYDLHNKANQEVLAKWSVILAKHILDLAEYDFSENEIILAVLRHARHGMKEKHLLTMFRKASFKVHELAKRSEDKLTKAP
jgi:hypothetical protein